MASTVERFEAVAQGCAQRIDGIGPDQWEQPTPCDGWTVRALVDHLNDNLDLLLGAVDRSVVDLDGESPGVAWRRRSEAFVAALSDPEVASVVVPSPLGHFAFKQVGGGVILHDVLVHTWDLAHATGQDERLDAEAVSSAFAKMQPFDELLRGPGMFGAKVEVSPDADEQVRFLAFLGRG